MSYILKNKNDRRSRRRPGPNKKTAERHSTDEEFTLIIACPDCFRHARTEYRHLFSKAKYPFARTGGDVFDTLNKLGIEHYVSDGIISVFHWDE